MERRVQEAASAASAPKRAAPGRHPGALLMGRMEGLQLASFDGGSGSSPSLMPSVKRPRAPPMQPMQALPALADGDLGDASWDFQLESQVAFGCSHSSSSDPTSKGDWKMVLYHDRNVVLYNPGETPTMRSRRLAMDEAPGSELSSSFGRCPLCRQTIDARFAFAAQAYFDLLQGLFRSTAGRESGDTSDDVDVLSEADLYRILGVARHSKPDDIKRAYRKRCLRFHPDKNRADSDAKLKFQKVAEAFSVLSDENKRAKYDSSGDMDLEDFDVETFMNMVNTAGFKFQKSPDYDFHEDLDGSLATEIVEGFREGGNPFLLPPQSPQSSEDVPVCPAVASEAGAAAEKAATAALRHLPPGLLNTGYYARFFVETKLLGTGSFGSVYLCRHVLDDLELGDYAVKKVAVGDNKAWLRDMIREVKTFERLHHPNIVEYKHSWLELSRNSQFCPLVPFLFILMQYCNGGSLDSLIWHDGNPYRPRAPMPTLQIWQLLLDILMGLQHLHRQGILHRDLKPTNILLTDEGGARTSEPSSRSRTPRALLSDFGTSAALGEPAGASAASRGYTGTVEYTAPELLGSGPVLGRDYTEKSDMWSAGIVLWAMCFSSLPFTHDDPSVLKGLIRTFVEERSQRQTDPSDWLPRDSSGRLGSLRLVLAALLSFDPELRPTATDLLENPIFRAQALRQVQRGRAPSDQAALPFV